MSETKVPTDPKKSNRVVAGLVVAATLLGGVAAVFQIKEALSVKQPAPLNVSVSEPDDSRTVDGPSGAKIRLEPGWSVVSREVMESTIPDMKEAAQGEATDVVYFEGPDAPGELTHMFGFFIVKDAPFGSDMAAMLEDYRSKPTCLLAESTDTPAGPRGHVLNEVHMLAPDGTDVVAKSEMFVWFKGGNFWSVTFSAPDRFHFQQSEDFVKMADSVELP